MVTPDFLCANWSENSTGTATDCKEVGRYSCKSCLLVVAKKNGLPTGFWRTENQLSSVPEDHWGYSLEGKNTSGATLPAFDVLQLGSNEGNDYGEQLSLLFAASGDFRNMVKTIALLPKSYSQPVDITMNDLDLDIVARNVIMLLIALTVDNIDEAADCIIHIWYSALIRKSDLNVLQQRIRPLIKDFYINIPEGLTAERANQIRTAVTLPESRKDYRDRHLLLQSRFHRIAKNRYWTDGLLLPFGSPRIEFKEPNPTFFQTADTWPIRDNADPLNGWSLKEVEDNSSGAASNDIYGKLFYYLRTKLRAFVLRLSDLQVSFRLFQLNASDLPNHLESSSFSRIEVANISDRGYLGIHRTVFSMMPLLQGPLVNPHATLITLFMNAVDESMTNKYQMALITKHSPEAKRLLRYLPPIDMGMLMNPGSPDIIRYLCAQDIVATYDHIFNRYENDMKFSETAQYIGAAVQEKHAVIEKWPFKLKLRPGQPGAQEEFDRLLRGGVSGKERYVEWKRISMGGDKTEDQKLG
ncbi:hypothetical protein V499_03938 [Pseudogymnoascus sp. VKM F-103]|nr:hypothetical protein V499_03938 [Pseudogymnoascus sp. VKM F-103]